MSFLFPKVESLIQLTESICGFKPCRSSLVALTNTHLVGPEEISRWNKYKFLGTLSRTRSFGGESIIGCREKSTSTYLLILFLKFTFVE